MCRLFVIKSTVAKIKLSVYKLFIIIKRSWIHKRRSNKICTKKELFLTYICIKMSKSKKYAKIYKKSSVFLYVTFRL